MVDCSTSNSACSGGLMHKAYDDLMYKHGLPLESDYPYMGIKLNCTSDVPNYTGAHIFGYNFVLSYSSQALKEALQYNPICRFKSLLIEFNHWYTKPIKQYLFF